VPSEKRPAGRKKSQRACAASSVRPGTRKSGRKCHSYQDGLPPKEEDRKKEERASDPTTETVKEDETVARKSGSS
jgi:hypothetical protein